MNNMKLAFIGGGNMANALIAGLRNKQFTMSDITVVELDGEKRQQLAQQYGVVTTDNLQEVAACHAIVLAIKPQQMPTLARTLAPMLNDQLVISIAAGIRLDDLSRWLGNYQHLVRCMPNTPAQIQQGISGLYAMPAVSAAEKAIADQVLSACGSTVWLEEENQIDAVTAISGSGPAYVFYFIEALQQAAIELGLDEAQAKTLSLATFRGAGLLAYESTQPVTTLRAQVTSKGGTTEQGILALEQAQVKQAIIHAAQQARNRAITLGDELGKDA